MPTKAEKVVAERERPEPRRRPGGRSARIRNAVAEATLQLLAEGNVTFGPGDVADRCGIHRSTIYRRWPAIEDLVQEALVLHNREVKVPDTGSWADDLTTLAHELAAFFASPVELAVNSLLIGGNAPRLREVWVKEWLTTVDEGLCEIVRRAIERGEVAPDVDPSAVINTLQSSLVLIPLALRRAATPQEIAQATDLIMRATSAPRTKKSGSPRRSKG